MAFDPCREWLGIDAVSLGDPARVLGVPDDCRDAAVIGRAAEARLESLRRVTPGPFARAHAALVARVEEARDSLLAAAFSARPATPPTDQRPSFAPRAHSFAPTSGPWLAAADEPAPSPTRFPASEVDGESPLGSPIRRTVARGRSSSGAGGLLLTAFALLAAAVAVMVFLMVRPDPFGTQVAVKKPAPAAPGTHEAKHPPGDPNQHPRQPAVVKHESATKNAARPPEMTAQATGGPTAAKAEPGDIARDDREAERIRKEAEARAREADRRRMEKEEQASREAEMAEQKAAAAAREAEEMRRREEMAAKEGEQQAAQERAKMQESLNKALRDAYAALQRGEFDTADRAIAAAGNHVGDDVEGATRIERWRLLATYAREFVKFRDQAYTAANSGREYAVDGKPFAIIEITADKFVYKLAGKIERASRETVDPRIAMAVVEGWFEADGRAANHLFLGAQWLCLDPPNSARAKAEWRKAGDGGEQVEPLMALLDDPVIRRTGS